MRRLLVVAAAALVAGVVVSSSFAEHARVSRAHVNGLGQKSCYPANEFVIAKGSFTGQSKGTTVNGSGEVVVAGTEYFDAGDDPPIDATWNFYERVTGNKGPAFSSAAGTMRGNLDLTMHATAVDFPGTGNDYDVTFTTVCISEATVGDHSVEAEFEGWAHDFPGTTGPVRAVASFQANFDKSGQIKPKSIRMAIELGTTCNEQDLGVDGADDGPPAPGDNFVTMNDGGTSVTSGTGANTGALDAGRAGLPLGFTPGTNPCPGTFYGE